ncbi:MAG: hypothetical protein CR972_01080 [Candidatus Moraniibacteriota bacterium]|nr:MAG: hypothetical protein CR972_01080 [Candidatus Moranbacteria bacterium]
MFGALAMLLFLIGCSTQIEDVHKETDVVAVGNDVLYDCQGEKIHAIFDEKNGESFLELTFLDRGTDLKPIVFVGSEMENGSKYTSGNITFLVQKDKAVLAVEESGKSIKCTLLNTEVIVGEVGDDIPKEDCYVWFDGCNTCKKDANGKLQCTTQHCAPEIIQSERCLDADIRAECKRAGRIWEDGLHECMEDSSDMTETEER